LGKKGVLGKDKDTLQKVKTRGGGRVHIIDEKSGMIP